jgi:hypothetical protein
VFVCFYSTEIAIFFSINQIISPLECERKTVTVTSTSTYFPVSYYYQIMLLHSEYLAQNYFNMSSAQALSAMQTGALSLTDVASRLDKKTLALNIFYEEMTYTTIEQVDSK